MENQEVVEQIAINCGVSMEDAAASIQRFCEAFGAISDVVESLYEAVKAIIEEIKQEIFICLMNEAYRKAIDEDKKPPDSRPNTNQADSAGLVGDPVSP